jgi:adenine deaminase
MSYSSLGVFSSLLHLFLAGCVNSAILYESGTIIAHDEATELPMVLRDAHLLIDGTKIIALSQGQFLGELPPDLTRINATNKIISPGFIDTRTSKDRCQHPLERDH